MGVRTKTVKRYSRSIIEKYYSRLTLDFDTNKRIVDEVAITPSKKIRNKIAGFITHLMARLTGATKDGKAKRIRGISLKLQEEERERKLDFVPEISKLERTNVEYDDDELRGMLSSIGYPLDEIKM